MPGFRRAQLTPGPLNDLVDALHQLHIAAGCPSARQLQREIGGAGVTSHTSVHKQFTGTTLPSWPLVELLVEVMAHRARLDEKAQVERFRKLWAQAHAVRSGNLANAPEPTISARIEVSRPNLSEGQEAFFQPISDLLPAVLDEIDAVGARSAIGSFRIPTGFDDLDSLLGGWSQGCLIIIGGRPSSGKTTLLLNFCRAASIKYRLPSMAISGEMSGRELQTRMLSAEARVPLYTIRTGKMTEEDRHRVARATAVIADAPIHIGTRSEFGIDQISADVTALAQASGLKLLIIDGLQWMADRQASAELSTEFFLWRLKRLAETLKIPIIITAQAERVRGRLPTTANSIQQLKDSDAIERVADVVIMLHRPDQDDMEHPRAGEAELIVAKNRNGPTATITVCYQYHYCRFIAMAPSNDPMFPPSPAESRSFGSMSTDVQSASVHDRQLYRQLLDKLDPGGPLIAWLKVDFMAKTQPSSLFDDLEQTVRSRGLEPIGFDNQKANDSHVGLMTAVDAFCSTVSWWTWMDEEQRWLSVPLDWREDDFDRWKEATEAILEKRNAVIKAYDEFLLTCHHSNIDHDPTDRLSG